MSNPGQPGRSGNPNPYPEGRFKPGHAGNPGGRSTPEMKALRLAIREKSLALFEPVVREVFGDGTPEHPGTDDLRLKAEMFRWLAEQAIGKAKQAVVGGDPEDGDAPVQHALQVVFVRPGQEG